MSIDLDINHLPSVVCRLKRIKCLDILSGLVMFRDVLTKREKIDVTHERGQGFRRKR
jgi:hypothetical protein